MSSSVTALVVSVVGVTGTLLAALLSQFFNIRTKKLELSEQHAQREREERQQNLRERRNVYIALNAAAREFRRTMKNQILESSADTSLLEKTRLEFDRRNAEGQLIGRVKVLAELHAVSTELSAVYGQLKKLPAIEEASAKNAEMNQGRELLSRLNGPARDRIRLLREAMREDLGVTEDH